MFSYFQALSFSADIQNDGLVVLHLILIGIGETQ